VIFQVRDNDPRKWNLALNNVKNVQDDLCPSRKSVVLDIVDVPLPWRQGWIVARNGPRLRVLRRHLHRGQKPPRVIRNLFLEKHVRYAA
jgi:hypothetical protein